MPWLAVAFALGAGSAIQGLMPGDPLLLIGAAVACAGLALLPGWTGGFAVWLPRIGFGLAALLAGLAAGQARLMAADAPILTRAVTIASLEAKLAAVEWIDSGPAGSARRVVLEDLHADSTGLPNPLPRRVRVTVAAHHWPMTDPPLRIGDRVQLRARLEPIPPPAMPGGFDLQRFLYFQEIGAIGRSLSPLTRSERAGEHEQAGDADWLASLRLRLGEAIRAALPGDTGAIAAALTIGDQSGISDATMAAMRDSGLAHILSVSGLHIGLVAMIVLLTVRHGLALIPPLALRIDTKPLACAVALAAIGAYAALAGWNVPVQRSFLMAGFALLAVMIGRNPLSMRGVAVAALVVLAWTPESLFGPSFQMSFAAVIGLIAGYEWLAPRLAQARLTLTDRLSGVWGGDWLARLAIGCLSLILTSLIASFATAPFALYHFQRLSLVGVLTNLLAVPLAGFAVMPAVILALIGFALGLPEPALWLLGLAVDALIALADFGADLPLAGLRLPALPDSALLALALAGLWLSLWQGRLRLLALPALVLGIGLAAASRRPDLLVAPGGFPVVLRQEDRLLIAGDRAGRWIRDTWADRLAADFVANADPARTEILRCDGIGCRFLLPDGSAVAVTRRAEGFRDDCPVAALIVTPLYRPKDCAAPLVFDRRLMQQQGAIALWVRPDGGFDWRSDAQVRGNRPWVRP